MATPSIDAATTPVMGGTAGDSPTGGNDDEATTTDVTGDNTGAGNEAQTPATTETNEIIIPEDAEMLVGTWRMGDSLVRFDADGSYQAAGAASDFDTDAASRGTWSMAEGVLTVTPADATVCEGQPGSYRVGMNEAGDGFRFTLEDDACADRAGQMDNVEVTRQTSN
jgi:hypothetical protein